MKSARFGGQNSEDMIMDNKNLIDEVPLECYWNHDWDILPAKKAYERAENSQLCWIPHLDLYLWKDQDEAGYIALLARQGEIPNSTAKGCLALLEEDIEKLKDLPLLLHRAPRADQLYEMGKPDIEIGSLKEGDHLRFGIRLTKGRVPHTLAAGSTGSGKSTLFRGMIIKIDSLE